MRRSYVSIYRQFAAAAVVAVLSASVSIWAAEPADDQANRLSNEDYPLSSLLAASDWGHAGGPEFRLANHKRLQLLAWFPEASVDYGYRHRVRDAIEYKDRYVLDDSQLIHQPAVPGRGHYSGTAHAFRITLTWYPDRIFRPEHASGLAKRQLAWGKLRRHRWDEVRELYQKRSAMLSRQPAPASALEKVNNELDIQEITALLDVRTNGFFSSRQPVSNGSDENGE